MKDFSIDINKLIWGENKEFSKRIGLYFGTFNPVHIGHLIIANHVVENTPLDEVWFVVSPHNPHKKKASLLEDYHRLNLVKEAIEDNDRLRASDIEFKLPQPSYTATTLAYLQEKYPKKDFTLIMGEDNLRSLHKWSNFETIVENHKIIVYPRHQTMQEKGLTNPEVNNAKIVVLKDVPFMDISASFIRKSIKENKSVKYLLTAPVLQYIDEMNFYK